MNIKLRYLPLIFLLSNDSGFINSASYFDYNYCESAHTIAEYYEVPKEEASLEYVAIIIRHTARAPANILPHEDVEWNCDDIEQYLYVQNQFRIIPSIKNEVTNPADNPFLSRYWRGNCQSGQITSLGLKQAIQFGRDIWKVYGEKLEFLPNHYDNKAIYIQTSTSTDVAGGLVAGLYPTSVPSDVVIYQQPAEVDLVEPGFSCNKYQSLLAEAKTTPIWQEHLNRLKALQDRLEAILDTKGMPDWSSWYDHYFDVFRTRQCHGLPLPCKISDKKICVTQSDADLVYATGNWEYNYLWRQQPNATYMTSLRMGPWLNVLKQSFIDAIEGGPRFRWYVAHDGSIANVIGALGITELLWPGWGANIVFEMWRSKESQRFVRVLYNGQPFPSNQENWDWVPLNEFYKRLDRVIPRNPLAECNTN